MCGVAGVFLPTASLSSDQLRRNVESMTNALVHRGPDSAGHWMKEAEGLAMGHRRLSIIDLSPAGSQPMLSHSGRYVIVFNGEIYNFPELRSELEESGWAVGWRGGSDTEVLLAAIERWGVEVALQRTVGMFAFGLWDNKEKQLTIARDRLGEKPLYYGFVGGRFMFCSELKALTAGLGFMPAISRRALTLYLRHNYVPAPHSIYQDVYKLLPGTYLQVSREGLSRELTPTHYWTLSAAISAGYRTPFEGSDEEAVERLDQVLRKSIRGQMISDVPLGAFLSGGIDSTTIVAIMQSESPRPVNTFTIGYNEERFNEAKHAKEVARHLGTNHHELYVTAEDARAVIPRLPEIYDEPFSDSSQIPTSLVASLARSSVTVSLSGDGGDELFCGYNRYAWGEKLWRLLAVIPPRMRRALASAIRAVPTSAFDVVGPALKPILPRRWHMGSFGDRAQKGAELLPIQHPQELYQNLISHWRNPADVVIGGSDDDHVVDRAPLGLSAEKDFVSWMMALDTVTYLPDDILVKVDRAAMAVSLETRVPFLDHRVVEFAWSLPQEMKVRNGSSKWILRQLVHKFVPREMMERPKMGFGVPLEAWLRGPLKPWAEELLSETALKKSGLFKVEIVRSMWREHISGKRNWQFLLWDVLMAESWMQSRRP